MSINYLNIKKKTLKMSNGSDLFNNPMIEAALKALTPEQLAHYKTLGEGLYNSVNFEDGTVIDNMVPPVEEAVAYIAEGLKSGLHPTALTEQEMGLMKDHFGEKWYERYGYTKNDFGWSESKGEDCPE
jgi:hypothetical protein